jgi:tetratricopeptide (TPR) repeat protein
MTCQGGNCVIGAVPPSLAIALARAGDVATARRLMASADVDAPPALAGYDRRFNLERARGVVALADGRTDEAVRRLQSAAQGVCDVCALPDLGRAYEKAGQPDSALAVYQRYADSSSFNRDQVDGLALAPTLRRLGELFENKGDARKAVEYYEQFVALYKNADPALQPLVADVRQRIARLARKVG